MASNDDNGAGLTLPHGVSLQEWSLEKTRAQNPRIRAFLGCIRVLDEVFESNYAILHCSPKRLSQIWEQVRKISTILRQEVAPLLSEPSKIPDLEEARESATVYFEALDREILEQIRRYPDNLNETHEPEVRKLLCVAIGQLHAFLLDTLGELLARDPRSHGDIDYFLTRKFARDVDETEWLHTSVTKLEDFLFTFSEGHSSRVEEVGRDVSHAGRLPTADEWSEISDYLHVVESHLVPRLKMVLGLRGIRLSELEMLDRHSSELPAMAQSLRELYGTAATAFARISSTDKTTDSDPGQVAVLSRTFSERIIRLMASIHDHIRDLTTYIPVWRQGIEQRRAMMLQRLQGA